MVRIDPEEEIGFMNIDETDFGALGRPRQIRHLEVEGVVVNQFQSRARLPKILVDELIEEGLPILEPLISPSVKIRESHSCNLPMIHLAPRHKVTEEFWGLHQTIDRL